MEVDVGTRNDNSDKDWSYISILSKSKHTSSHIAVLHVSIYQLDLWLYPSPAPRRGGGDTVLPLSVRPRYFSSHFSQQLLMAEIWYLVTSLPHIMGSGFGPIRFLFPVCRFCWFLYTFNIHLYMHIFLSNCWWQIWYLVTSFI